MGAGIAAAWLPGGRATLLHDPVGEALERGLERIVARLDREVARGRLSEAEAADASRACSRPPRHWRTSPAASS